MSRRTHRRPSDHPGLENDEATDEGKPMTAEGVSDAASPEGPPTVEDHPGLDSDEATEAGKMMTAEGSIGVESTEGDPV